MDAQAESDQNKKRSEATPNKQILTAMLGEIKHLLPVKLQEDCTISFDLFLDTSSLVLRYLTQHTGPTLKLKAGKRRAALRAKNGEEHTKLLQECVEWEVNSKTLLQSIML